MYTKKLRNTLPIHLLLGLLPEDKITSAVILIHLNISQYNSLLCIIVEDTGRNRRQEKGTFTLMISSLFVWTMIFNAGSILLLSSMDLMTRIAISVGVHLPELRKRRFYKSTISVENNRSLRKCDLSGIKIISLPPLYAMVTCINI